MNGQPQPMTQDMVERVAIGLAAEIHGPDFDPFVYPETWLHVTTLATKAIEATGVVELRELLLASTECLESVIAAMDQYNEKHGTYIIGPSLLGSAKQIAANRQVLTQLAKGSE